MIVCTCGKDFRTIKTGTFALYHGKLYAADLLECESCHKRILDTASAPITHDPEEQDRILMDLTWRGVTVYG